jgi:transcriptional regulator with XRE-family HTH domain
MAPDLQTTKPLQQSFGRLLRKERKAAGKGQKALAGALRVTRTTVSNIERGQQRVYLDQLFEAARFLGISPEKLLPPLAEVFPPNSILTPTDDPLSAGKLAPALAVASEIRSEHATTLGQTRAKRRRRSR